MSFFPPRLVFPDKQARYRLLLCASIFAILVIWLYRWPYTGDGDSMLHYWNLRLSWYDFKLAVTPWARPAYVLLTLIPARGGLYAVRIFAALIAVILAWQTMRMADDLRLRNASLAGVFVIFQPLAFALASDTMTEIPMALGLVLSLRCWINKRWVASCLLMSVLPYLRPEGFFLALLWGVAILALPYTQEFPVWWKRFFIGSLLLTGTVCVIVIGFFISHDALFFWHEWPWQTGLTEHGSFWHHFIRWPYYCGWVLFPLFMLGIIPALRRAMILPWAAWILIFGLHTVMFWKGTFGALGLMRIMVCTAPVTALICLYGWNALAHILQAQRWPRWLQQSAAATVMIGAMLTAMFYYYADPSHHRFRLARQAAAFVQQNNLLKTAPRLFLADPMMMAELHYPDDKALMIFHESRLARRQLGQLARNYFVREESLHHLESLPSGSLGIWDNEQGYWWHKVKPEEFPALGYQVLFSVSQDAKDFDVASNYKISQAPISSFFTLQHGTTTQKVIVVSKKTEEQPPRDVIAALE